MISVRHLGYTYARADRPAIRDLDFEVSDGEIFGFLGPNGAGKSTTQKVLIRLLRDYDGEVEVFGRPLGDWGHDYFERVGVSFELPNHYLKLSAAENLRYFRSLYSGRTRGPEELLELVDLAGAAGVVVSQFSKGMKSRLSIARALLNEPELIFLDEPTSGLDPVGARRIKDIVLDQRRHGTTVFLTTHDMTVAAELCDRVAFLVDGRIEIIDAPRALELAHGEHRVLVECRCNGEVERRDFPLEGLADNHQFQELLRNGKVQTIHSQEATLEDVFIRVTGRDLT